MAYYINLFTEETWREIRLNAGWEFTGHTERRRNSDRIGPGDVFLCWITKTSAFVAALNVQGGAYTVDHEEPQTWRKHLYPKRFKTELRVRVPITKGVTLAEIRERTEDPSLWNWVFRNSGNEIPAHDGDWILRRLEDTQPRLGATTKSRPSRSMR